MTSQKQLKFAYGLAVNLLIIGIACYIAFSTNTSEEPARIVYKTNAGKVIFDHYIHCSLSGYGLSCKDCHHHGESITISCSNCHFPKGKNNNSFENCLNCHEFEDIENSVLPHNSEAFHSQCVQCHENIDSGAKECSQCHIL